MGPKLKLRLKNLETDDLSIWHRFRRNLSITLLGSGVSVAIKLCQTALLITLLEMEDYGRLLIVLNLVFFLDAFFGVRVSDVMFRFYQQFREQADARALKGLLILCVSLSFASGLAICGGVVVLSPWLVDRLYPGLGLSPLLTIYSFTLLVSSFTGIYEPILRLHDRFTSAVVPQVAGSFVTLAMICTYFVTASQNAPGGYRLEVIVIAFAVGVLVQACRH